VPPVAVNWTAEIAVPTTAAGRVVAVTVSFDAIVILKDPETVLPFASVAVTAAV
jgi:hypothetical protein